MTAVCKITYSAADGRRVPPHYVRVTAGSPKAWSRKAEKAARAARLHDESIVAIARGDDRPYELASPADDGVRVRIRRITSVSRPPMRGLTPVH
jgi:hypothetical protein